MKFLHPFCVVIQLFKIKFQLKTLKLPPKMLTKLQSHQNKHFAFNCK